MRRFFCWFIVFVIFISLFPARAFAEEMADAPKVEEPISEKTEISTENSLIPAAPSPPSIAAPEPPPSLVPALVSNTPVSGPETMPDIIATTLNTSTVLEYVELYNQSDTPIDISRIVFRVLAGGETCQVASNETGWVLPDNYITLRSPTAGIATRHIFNHDCALSSSITRFELFYNDSRLQLIDGITNGSWLRHVGAVKTNTKTALDCTHKLSLSTLKQSGIINDYVKCSGTADLFEGTLYTPPARTDLKIMEILPNARNCPPSDQAFDCSDYIKVKNISSTPVNLAELRVRSGNKLSNASVTSSFNWHQPTLNPDRDELLLPAGHYFLLRFRNDGTPISLTGGDGNVWIEDYYGVKTYDEASYGNMDLAAASGKSWAFDTADSQWKLGIPSPGGDNTFPVGEPGKGNVGDDTSLKPCRDDQYRSEETHRCRNIVTAGTPAPCKEGQYRSEETNRCRSIASAAAAVLKPCADDQFRSPITNRCRKIASSDDVTLADCGEGRERNPETHRCRNVKNGKVPDAAFAVEPLKQTGKAFIGWWALGGLTMAAAGYGAWEWRREMLVGIRKVTSFFSSKK